MDLFLGIVIVVILGLAIAPMFLMRGQFKPKARPGRTGDGADVSPAVFLGSGSGGKSKGQPDNTSDSGSDGGGDGGGGGGGE